MSSELGAALGASGNGILTGASSLKARRKASPPKEALKTIPILEKRPPTEAALLHKDAHQQAAHEDHQAEGSDAKADARMA